MMKTLQKNFLIIIGIFYASGLFAQNSTPQLYVATYKDLAMREMRRMGVPAAIKLAQGLLETEAGNSPLLKKSNNHFGIKCKSSWSGNGVSHDDDAPGECFRVYNSAEDSYRDHSNFLRGSERYAFLFELDPTDYKGWAYGLKRAGYATNPRYPEILIRNIEQYGLQQYSLAAASDVPRFDRSAFQDDPQELSMNTQDKFEDVVSLESTFSVIRFNGLSAVKASRGASLLAIATARNIPLRKLLEYNDFEKDGLLDADMPIYLEPKEKAGKVKSCLSEPGQTLHALSQQYGVQLAELRKYNNLKADGPLAPGKRILLQTGDAVASTQSSASVTSGGHVVQPKEGLYAISKKYGVSVQQLRDWNGLNSDSLRIGQQLIVAPR